ncbi:MAG: hypothetical protein RQ754_10175 [Desulfuromonadales bacterium]|nr:hypothetical protein [Desulfuromonadales bacterium]
MNKISVMLLFCITFLLTVPVGTVSGAAAPNGQIKGLDEQVQEIKGDVLAIAAELNQLEERLLFPSHTQISMFLSLAANEQFRLDSVEIKLDGKPVAHHLYSFKELEALRMGGVQRLYTGNVKIGEHAVEVSYAGLSAEGEELRETQQFRIQKDERPGIFDINLARHSISLQDW